uniref:Uncharacterized protein n=1 Tax=Kalanchoe fedtschenkoi TaxID=63787 RepID=A0A7N0VLB2_KALFE
MDVKAMAKLKWSHSKHRSIKLHRGQQQGLPWRLLRLKDLMLGGTSLGQGTDVIKLKSKGADYRYLISEAWSQASSTGCLDLDLHSSWMMFCQVLNYFLS